MHADFERYISEELQQIREAGLYKSERNIVSPQAGRITVNMEGVTFDNIVNLCANNYLGLANHPELKKAASNALDELGFGLASVRFICGTQDQHRKLERKIAEFLGAEDAILYAACFDANGGLFEPLLGPEDAIVSDELNHASIIDGVRLCKARRYRYANSDMSDLERQLRQARADNARFIIVATDGVFSMDGYIANLPEIRRLADQYEALVMVDDCHAVGFMGSDGAGTPSHFNMKGQIDILTGTLGKALGGALGGYTAASQVIVDMLRQRSRPYLFSNSLPPSIVSAGMVALDIVKNETGLRDKLQENTTYWRSSLEKMGFSVLPGEHPIVPVMLGDAGLAQQMAAGLFKEGVFVSGFFYPVVPKGKARIRTQMSAALNRDDLEFAAEAFGRVGKNLGAAE